MLTRKTKYALKALVDLGERYGQEPVLISELARRERIPKKFLELILLDLKNHGILRSKKGRGGGYSLAKAPREIRIGSVVRLFDGPLAPVACASQTAYAKCEDCRDERTCVVRTLMTAVRDSTARILDGTTLDSMLGPGTRSAARRRPEGVRSHHGNRRS